MTAWGDAYGNRVDRFNGGMAFVKDTAGKSHRAAEHHPAAWVLHASDGVCVLTWRNGGLAKNWVYDSDDSGIPQGAGQGDHSEMAADTDGDVAQEIITGAATIGSDGTLQCTIGNGPWRCHGHRRAGPGKGITVFSIHEGLGGMDSHDGATCTFYFKITEPASTTVVAVADYVGPGNETSCIVFCRAAPGICTWRPEPRQAPTRREQLPHLLGRR